MKNEEINLKNTEKYINKIKELMKCIVDRSIIEFKKQFYVNTVVRSYYFSDIIRGNVIPIKVHPTKKVSEKENYQYKFARDLEVNLKNRFVHFEINDYEMNNLLKDKNFELPGQVKDAIQSISTAINNSLYEKYKGVNQSFIFPSKKGSWFNIINQMHKLFNTKHALAQDRFLFFNMDLYLNLLEDYKIYQASANNDFHRYYYGPNQYIGDIGGFKSYYDIHLPYHQSGILGDNNTAKIKTGLNTKDNVLSLYFLKKTDHLNKGDLIFFEEDPNKTYTILNDIQADINGMLEVDFYPDIDRNISKDSLIGVIPSHFVSLAFQKNAFVYVNRGLDQYESLIEPNALTVNLSDLELSFRLEVRRGYEVEVFEFDVAWEIELINPMYAIRILSF